HPDPPAHLHRIDPGGVDVLTVEQDLALGPGAGYDLMHPIEAAHEGGFAASRGPDDRGDHVGRKRQVDRVQRAGLVEPGAEIAHDELVNHGAQRGIRASPRVTHLTPSSSASTIAVSTSAPAHA